MATARKRTPPAKKTTTALVLKKRPFNANGSVNNTLVQTVQSKFDRISLLNPSNGSVVAILHTTDKDESTKNIGSHALGYVYALIDAALAGQGAGPDGSALFVHEFADEVEAHYETPFHDYVLKCEPGGRAGAAAYQAPLSVLRMVADAKAVLVQMSIDKFGTAKTVQRKKKVREETIEVAL
jgi:hypothetical protein